MHILEISWLLSTGFELTHHDSGCIFQFLWCKFSHLVKNSWYQSLMQFLNPKQRNFFSAAVKNNFNVPGMVKLHTCIHYILRIITFTNCHTWSFSFTYLTIICTSGFLIQGIYVYHFMFYILHPIFKILLWFIKIIYNGVG